MSDISAQDVLDWIECEKYNVGTGGDRLVIASAVIKQAIFELSKGRARAALEAALKGMKQ